MAVISNQTEFGQQDVEVLDDKKVFDGFFEMRELRLRHKLFKGGWGSEIKRELFVRGTAVGILLFDPSVDEIVLIKQFRIGPWAAGAKPWVLELAAGIVESGEDYEDVAHRETKEETGAEISSLIPICDYFVSPGGTDEQVKLFCGIVDAAGCHGIHGLEDEGEDILVVKVSRQQAFDAVRNGLINNAATIIALQWLELNKEQF